MGLWPDTCSHLGPATVCIGNVNSVQKARKKMVKKRKAVLFSGLHIEMVALEILVDWLRWSGW